MSTKKKQGLLLTLAIVLILAGIFQQNLGKWGNSLLSYIFPANTAAPEDSNVPEGTDEPDPTEPDVPAGAEPMDASSHDPSPTPGKTTQSVTPSPSKVDYFSTERIARDSSRGRMKDEYEKITKDANASVAIKTSAYESIMELTRMAEAEKKIEILIEEKGFVDCFACFSDAGEIDVIVKADSLSESDVAKIADIVSRHGNVTMDKIHVRSVK